MDKAERDMRRMEGIIHSMTKEERRKPDIKATPSAGLPLAHGCSGAGDVNRLLNQFGQMGITMKKLQ